MWMAVFCPHYESLNRPMLLMIENRMTKIDGHSKQRWRKCIATIMGQSHIFREEGMMTYHCLSISPQIIAQFFGQWYRQPILNRCGISDHLFFTPLVYNHKCKLVIKITSLPQTSRVDVCNNCCWNQNFRQWNQRHWIHHWWNGTFQVTKVEIAIFMAFKSGFIRIEA